MQEIRKPTFIIIGSAKCGTTALASILAAHPDCCMSEPKEVSFFQDTIDFQPNSNYEKGWEWYQQAFSHYNGEVVVGEATPSYSDRSRSPSTAKRIYDFNPHMKIIYMVRDPLARQISGWKMQYAMGKGKYFPWRREDEWALKGFEYWMRMQKSVRQWDECRYSYQLEAYEEYFPKENICISFIEDWRLSKKNEVIRIMSFLGLDTNLWDTQISENANRLEDRKVERSFLKKMQKSSRLKGILRYLPLSVRNWAKVNIAYRHISYPTTSLSDATKNEFIDYICEDARSFLRSNGKDLDLWTTCAYDRISP